MLVLTTLNDLPQDLEKKKDHYFTIFLRGSKSLEGRTFLKNMQNFLAIFRCSWRRQTKRFFHMFLHPKTKQRTSAPHPNP